MLADKGGAGTGALVPVGASTQQEFGNPLLRADCAIDLTGLNRISAYNPADLTIHLEAGVTLRQLQAALAPNTQFLPLDPWCGPEATIGGVAAVNAQGPYRAIGTIRDWIIGMKVVQADGRVSKTGGRVVKNVTGYDLAKLYTGSLGSLAIIAEISLKLRSAFGKTATATTTCGDLANASELLRKIRSGPLQPVSAEWIGPENAVWLRFGEHPRAVDWQLKNLPKADWRIAEGPDEAGLWEDLRNRCIGMQTLVKVVAAPSEIGAILERYRPAAWIGHALNGIVLMTVADAAQIWEIRRAYRTVIERAPLQWRRETPTFGLGGAEYELMRKMKTAFDPEGRLNPGRHVDGERN